MADPLPADYAVGYWSDAGAFKLACGAARDAGFPGLTAFAPFPVHGLEHTLGHQRSWIGRAVLVAICLGGFGCLQFFVATTTGFPINVSGKPLLAPEFWVVEILEAALLAGALVNLVACFHACKLMPGDHQVVDPRATDDQFCLLIPVAGERYSAESLTRWLGDRGAERVECRTSPAPVEAAHA